MTVNIIQNSQEQRAVTSTSERLVIPDIVCVDMERCAQFLNSLLNSEWLNPKCGLKCTVSGSIEDPHPIADWPEALTTALNHLKFGFKYGRIVLIRNMAVFIASKYPAEIKTLSVLRKLHDSILKLPLEEEQSPHEMLTLSGNERDVITHTLSLMGERS